MAKPRFSVLVLICAQFIREASAQNLWFQQLLMHVC
jgi:hypothetical protein